MLKKGKLPYRGALLDKSPIKLTIKTQRPKTKKGNEREGKILPF
jgi:hypothetical protein